MANIQAVTWARNSVIAVKLPELLGDSTDEQSIVAENVILPN